MSTKFESALVRLMQISMGSKRQASQVQQWVSASLSGKIPLLYRLMYVLLYFTPFCVGMAGVIYYARLAGDNTFILGVFLFVLLPCLFGIMRLNRVLLMKYVIRESRKPVIEKQSFFRWLGFVSNWTIYALLLIILHLIDPRLCLLFLAAGPLTISLLQISDLLVEWN